jgi:hypothetical protein
MGWAGLVQSGYSRGDNRVNRHQLDVLGGDYRHASSRCATVACIKLVAGFKLVRDYRHPLPAACSVGSQGSLPHSNLACIKLARAQPSQSPS